MIRALITLKTNRSTLVAINARITAAHPEWVDQSTTSYGVVVDHPAEDLCRLDVDQAFINDFTEGELSEYGVENIGGGWE